MKIAMLGFGNIGEAFYNELKQYYPDIEVIKILVRDVNKKRAFENLNLTNNFSEINNNLDINVIVDVTSGTDSVEYIKLALKSKKNVITANKMVVSLAYNELIELAIKNNVNFYFEAAVGGGIPLIHLINENIKLHRIKKVVGILNGTTNYILTKMLDENLSFEETLKLAQSKGFAEPDPSFDILGYDCLYKINILKNLLFTSNFSHDKIFCKGIENISIIDLNYGKLINSTLKLVGYIINYDFKIDIGVSPVFLPNHHPLANVKNEFNALYIEGEPIGEVMLFGRGAGKNPTTASLISDLLRIKREKQNSFNLAYKPSNLVKEILESENKIQKNYFRFTVIDKPGVISKITSIFEKYNLSISSMKQDISKANEKVDVIFTTHEAKVSVIPLVLNEIKAYDFLVNEPVWCKIDI